ncbi:MAG: 2-nitropropane dioxygenase [Caulobacteraceae bacterium]|nr:2-nitropropane dioxygenase [Caulobacteraceae bacterium]
MEWSQRTDAFCVRYGLRVPILLAPMAGVSAPSLSIAVARAGGLGACGALLMQPGEIVSWTQTVRAASNGAFQLNLWIPDPPPMRDGERERRAREFLSAWGPPVPPEAGNARPPDFTAQCEALLEAGAPVVSSVMGLFPPDYVARLKAAGAAWFATASTVAEAEAAQAAGADAVIVQGMEAGGHRAAFCAEEAERAMAGLFSLLPIVADRVRVPVIATGGIADGRGVAAALTLGASAVQIGTGFMRCPEAQLPPAWSDALAHALPEQTLVTRAFSGRAGRSLATAYALAAAAPEAPEPAPYPVQRGLTAAMRAAAVAEGALERMQAWAGQSASLASNEPAGDLVERLWSDARRLLP